MMQQVLHNKAESNAKRNVFSPNQLISNMIHVVNESRERKIVQRQIELIVVIPSGIHDGGQDSAIILLPPMVKGNKKFFSTMLRVMLCSAVGTCQHTTPIIVEASYDPT